ncbi:ABC-type nitrate/sulfonate/bicarbonate transport system, substrate-binding protein [Marivirga sericea]|uniref:Thiamine pyrimidine synthase n=1 Tax=Marivirga sericea TaxID=1028 RepID=A0A1X7K005_9BACT|nr:ABC transporter substrate-binding protein [Marivirga sericea]SMG34116.1 ABC-type nitrate/sulfonate/bicarbonate transport system, substrate-binding protein [Marivirga sericea]
MELVKLALDWTPNTNHTGFFVAQAKGFYDKLGVKVEIRSPEVDNYEKTPAKLVEEKWVELGIAPSESVITYQTLDSKPNLTAVAAILQKDASAIVSLANGKIQSIKDLDGKIYASYNARFEDHIVEAMIKKGGGNGEFTKSNPDKLGIWDTLLEGKADATWVFMPWEGILAKRAGIILNDFRLNDYSIPYGYSPILLAHPEVLESKGDAISKFLKASAKGFLFAKDHPEDAIKILAASGTQEELKDEKFLLESQESINHYYTSENGKWGLMEDQRWETFTNWLKSENLLNKETLSDHKSLYTNKFL